MVLLKNRTVKFQLSQASDVSLKIFDWFQKSKAFRVSIYEPLLKEWAKKRSEFEWSFQNLKFKTNSILRDDSLKLNFELSVENFGCCFSFTFICFFWLFYHFLINIHLEAFFIQIYNLAICPFSFQVLPCFSLALF